MVGNKDGAFHLLYKFQMQNNRAIIKNLTSKQEYFLCMMAEKSILTNLIL